MSLFLSGQFSPDDYMLRANREHGCSPEGIVINVVALRGGGGRGGGGKRVFKLMVIYDYCKNLLFSNVGIFIRT